MKKECRKPIAVIIFLLKLLIFIKSFSAYFQDHDIPEIPEEDNFEEDLGLFI